MNEQVSNSQFRGFIEGAHAGKLHGWAAAKTHVAPLELVVVANGLRLGAGRADIYREDLKNADIHGGYHGFEIEIDCSLLSAQSASKAKTGADVSLHIDSVHTVSVQLVEASTAKPVDHNAFELKTELSRYSAHFWGVKGAYVELAFASAVVESNKHVSLLIDGNAEAKLKLACQNEPQTLRFLVPPRYFDRQHHRFDLLIEGEPAIIASALLRAEPYISPWPNLVKHYDSQNILAVSQVSGQRYHSLKYQCDEALKSGDYERLATIVRAHDILCQNAMKRDDYPALDFEALAVSEAQSVHLSVIVYCDTHLADAFHVLASLAFVKNKVPFEITLVINGLSDEGIDQFQSAIKGIKVLHFAQRQAYSELIKRASLSANSEHLFILSSNLELQSHCLDELVNALSTLGDCALVSPMLINQDGSLYCAGRAQCQSPRIEAELCAEIGYGLNPFDCAYNYTRQIDAIPEQAFCVRRQHLLEFLNTGESESDGADHFCQRLATFTLAQDLRCYYTPFAKIHLRRQVERTAPVSVKTERFKDYGVNKRILVIDYTSPEKDRDAGSYAMFQEMKLMQALGFKVSFIPRNLTHYAEQTAYLQRMGVEVIFAPFYMSVERFIVARIAEFNAVYIMRYYVAEQYIDLIRSRSNAKILFNNADLHFLREMRAAQLKPNETTLMAEALLTRDAELAVCKKVDAVLCYTQEEHEVIQQYIDIKDKLHITPWVLEANFTDASFDTRDGICFLGSFSHHPNVEALAYLCEQIMPALEKTRPDIILYVYGSNMSDDVRALESANVKIMGFAPSLEDVFNQHRIFVAPLLSGAGIKGKVLDAMAHGVPCILSDIAAEGTGLINEVSFLRASTVEDYCASITRLYLEEELWKTFRANILLAVQSKFSKKTCQHRLAAIFRSLD